MPDTQRRQSTGDVQHDLMQVSEKEYGASFRSDYLEQYKLYVEMADRISARRMLSHTFFLTVNAGAVAAIATAHEQIARCVGFWMVPPLLALMMLSFVWWRTVESYRQLNDGKYKIVAEMEKHLPAAPYATEWVILGRGNDPQLYRPLTHVERWVPFTFMILYVLLLIMVGYSCANSHGATSALAQGVERPIIQADEVIINGQDIQPSRNTTDADSAGRRDTRSQRLGRPGSQRSSR